MWVQVARLREEVERRERENHDLKARLSSAAQEEAQEVEQLRGENDELRGRLQEQRQAQAQVRREESGGGSRVHEVGSYGEVRRAQGRQAAGTGKKRGGEGGW